MKDITTPLKYQGKTYTLAFNINVMEEIQEAFGSLENWGQLSQPNGGEPNLGALRFGLAAMINEGIDIENEENGTKNPPLTLKQVGRIISSIGMEQTASALNSTVSKSVDTGEKNESSTKKKKK